MCVGLVLASEMFLLSRLVVSKGEEEGSNMNALSGSSSSSGSWREVGEKERKGRGIYVSDTKMKLRQLEKERKQVLEKMVER